MIRTITIQARYPRDANVIFAELLDLAELKAAMARIATYDGLPHGVVSEGDTYTVDVTLWGLLKTRDHVMHIERLDRDRRILQSREHNPSVARWDHRITVEPDPTGALWTDEIVLDAGWQTPFTALFCRYVYRQRHVMRQASSIHCAIERGVPRR